MTTSKPFFPRDKPKSFVVGVSAGLIALLVVGPLAFLGKIMSWAWLFKPAIAALFLCWLTFTVMWLIAVAGTLTGRYKDLSDRDWDEQVW